MWFNKDRKRKLTSKDETNENGGIVQVDKRTKDLTKRLKEGNIAVINHVDIDRIAAEALISAKPKAVLNAAKSTSGRYPNLGPELLVEAGITLIDDLGLDVMSLKEGSEITIEGNSIRQSGELIAKGIRQDEETIKADLDRAREGLSTQLESFAVNTMEYMRKERELLLDGVGVPEGIKTKFEGRHALIVVRGYHYQEDLRMLRGYIKEYRPILIGVDGGADAIIAAGLTPNLIVGDMDSVSDDTLKCGAEIVVHAYKDGRTAPGIQRVRDLAVEHIVFPATGTSEDIAMLISDDLGAEVIVAVGTHATLVEFLDKGRSGMASTFLTRLRVGSKLIDAKGVSRLYRRRISSLQLTLLALAGLLAIVAALVSTAAGQTMLGLLAARWDDLVSWINHLF